jgi:multiple antibiotic resistance protein
MGELLTFGIFCFTTFVTIINPISILPVFMTMTANFSEAERRNTAVRAVLTAFLAMLFFAMAGNFVFKFFNITPHAFRVVGGVLFFKMGYDMLNARLTRIKILKKDIREYSNDISITPLGIPMLCGPGAITNSILLMKSAESTGQQVVLLISIVAICLMVLFALLSGSRIIKFIGETGIKVMMRIMGLILMVIAIEYFFAGIKPFALSVLEEANS